MEKKPDCILCGGSTGDYDGLCNSCCRSIQARRDAFARKSQAELAEARKLEDELKAIEDSKDKAAPAAAAARNKKDDEEIPSWPSGMPL